MRVSTILLTLLVLGAGVFGLQLMSSMSAEPPVPEKREPEVAVAVIEAQPRSHRPVISIIGTVEAKDQATLTSPINTQVDEVLVEEGDLVNKGDNLVRLDVRETNFQIEAQLAALDDIDAQLAALERDQYSEQRRLTEIRELGDLANVELERNRRLFESGLVAEAAVNGAEAAVTSRELELIGQRQRLSSIDTSRRRLEASKRGAQAQIGQLRVVLERARIRSPFNGIVKGVHTSAGTRIGAGQPIVDLYDPETIRLRAAIPNENATGTGAAALEGLIDTVLGQLPVSLQSIAPEAKAGRGTVDALFTLPPGDWLLGTAVEFSLLLPEVPAALAVPFDALYSGNRVYRIDADSRAEAVDCAGAGQTQAAGSLLALLQCPTIQRGDRLVANRIPNLVSGTKVRGPGEAGGERRQRQGTGDSGGDAGGDPPASSDS